MEVCTVTTVKFILVSVCIYTIAFMLLQNNQNGFFTERPLMKMKKETNKLIDIKADQIKRQSQLRDFCSKHSTYGEGRLHYTIVSQKMKAMWCYIPKVSTTNWMHVFWAFEHANYTFLEKYNKDIHNLVHDSGKIRRIGWLQQHNIPLYDDQEKPIFFSFLIVREPFERIVSAFRDKLMDKNNTHYQGVKRFIQGYMLREHGIPTNNFNFSVFVKYIIDKHKTGPWDANDEHWNSYEKLCNPCSTNYSFIMKIEKLVPESNYVFQKLGLNTNQWKFNLGMNRYSKKARATRTTESYYETLSSDLIRRLYECYKNDFEMFGYEKPSYVP